MIVKQNFGYEPYLFCYFEAQPLDNVAFRCIIEPWDASSTKTGLKGIDLVDRIDNSV